MWVDAQSCAPACWSECLFFFGFEKTRHTSAAAAEFPRKSERIHTAQKEKAVGRGAQLNKFAEKGRGVGKIIRKEGHAGRGTRGREGRQSFRE